MDQEKLFKDYIAICNKALEHNKNQFPFGKILSAVKTVGHSIPTHVEIIDDVSCNVYELQLSENTVNMKPKKCGQACGQCGNLCHSIQQNLWQVKASYLQNVVADPASYIENPAKLDWEWINTP